MLACFQLISLFTLRLEREDGQAVLIGQFFSLNWTTFNNVRVCLVALRSSVRISVRTTIVLNSITDAIFILIYCT